MAGAAQTSKRTPPALKAAAVLLVVAVVLLGVWVTGALISDDMNVAMALTAVWFGIVGLACLLAVRARRDLLLPVLGTFVAAAVAIGGYLGYSSLVDQEVNETVAVGAPAGEAPQEPGAAAPAQNVQLATGGFESGAHETSGTAAVVELAEGGRVLTLTGFETDPGPDLRVYLATDRDASESEDLGALKGNVGDQQYELPEGADLDRLSTVVIWCRAFSVEFGSAALTE
ncbi:MAG: DM13 domain-containing protein [Thermoleophilaceae bacterium]